MDFKIALPLAIFALTYFVIAAGKVPRIRLDRAGAAMAGATAMVVAGVLSQREAVAAVDFPTLGLLLGMMIVVANLRLSGALGAAAHWALSRAQSGFGLLAMTIASCGVLAAVFINDVVCLALAPILIEAARVLDADPTPFLLALATASNIGSAATITGNPQNIIVAGYAHLGYASFAMRLIPVAVAGLVIDYAVIAWVYRHELARHHRIARRDKQRRSRQPRSFMIKSSLIAIGALACFSIGLPTYLVALAAGALSLFTRRVRPERVYALIDWTMLLMFAGLFIVVAGAETSGFQGAIIKAVGVKRLAEPILLASVAVVLANLVSNVPAVMLLKPFYASMGQNRRAAMIIASASTLAGNLTVLGSMANLIVLEQARRQKIEISFGSYLRVGVPITVLTVIVDLLLLKIGA
jgi:Na+/H+ antiporter NhaD/arsenite permease-like protein